MSAPLETALLTVAIAYVLFHWIPAFVDNWRAIKKRDKQWDIDHANELRDAKRQGDTFAEILDYSGIMAGGSKWLDDRPALKAELLK